jgi:hypothetical protein
MILADLTTGLVGRILYARTFAMNCWEFRKCGREPGGRLADQDGVCPAAVYNAADGYLGGRNGGCACAFIAGTFCEEVLQGTYRDKSKDCWDCEFYRMMRHEHGAGFSMPAFALHLMKRNKDAFNVVQRENCSSGERAASGYRPSSKTS